MKRIVIFTLRIYQVVFSLVVKQLLGIPASCRYSPTCSVYMQQKIMQYGIVKGGTLGVKRLLTCHPFSKPYAAV
jgi:putative membrane protein insertion efficiency factor